MVVQRPLRSPRRPCPPQKVDRRGHIAHDIRGLRENYCHVSAKRLRRAVEDDVLKAPELAEALPHLRIHGEIVVPASNPSI